MSRRYAERDGIPTMTGRPGVYSDNVRASRRMPSWLGAAAASHYQSLQEMSAHVRRQRPSDGLLSRTGRRLERLGTR